MLTNCHHLLSSSLVHIFFVALITLSSAKDSSFIPTVKGDRIYELQCTVQSLEHANDGHLNKILDELLNTTFFRLMKVNLESKNCPFEKNSATEPLCGTVEGDGGEQFAFGGKKGGAGEKKVSHCTLSTDDGGKNPFQSSMFTTDNVNKVLTKAEIETIKTEGACHDPNLGEFWLDLCHHIPTNSSKHVNLRLNDESNTGYNGTKVWAAIYEENCFSRAKNQPWGGRREDNLCYEERVLYRLLSGMHTSTNIHIALKYYAPRKGKRKEWEPEPKIFKKFLENPDWISNLHFSFVVMYRAVQRAAPILQSFDYASQSNDKKEALHTQKLVEHFLSATILRDCAAVYESFDESIFFGDKSTDVLSLKKQFKDVFQNITKLLDCVTCEKCKLHGKVQLLGIGTALKILLLPEHLLIKSISQQEIVALFNALQKMSNSIAAIPILTKMYELKIKNEEKTTTSKESTKTTVTSSTSQTTSVVLDEIARPPYSSTPSDRYNTNELVRLAASLSQEGLINEDEENLLIDAAMHQVPGLIALAGHYVKNTDKFLSHFRRNMNQIIRQVGDSNYEPVYKADNTVIIVGGGLAGMSCAVTLLDRGFDVTLIDKNSIFGGNSAKASSGINGVLQPHADTVHDSIALFAKDMLKSGYPDIYNKVKKEDGSIDVKALINYDELTLLRVLTSESGEAVNWVQKRTGIVLDKTSQLGGHSVPRTYRPSEGIAGFGLILALQGVLKQFEEAESGRPNITFLKQSEVEKLIQNDEGRVIGVEFKNLKDKKKGKLFSKHTVVATGGFGYAFTKKGKNEVFDESSLLNQYRPDLSAFPTTNGKWATGDGHKFLQQIGAGNIDMNKVQIHPTAFVDVANRKTSVKVLCGEILRGVGGIILNAKGHRFVNELGARDHISGKMMEESKTHTDDDPTRTEFNLILNEKIAQIADKHVPLYTKKNLLFKFDTLEEAADWMSITVETLTKTLSKYNTWASKTGPDEFGKTTFNSLPFPEKANEGPLYIGKITPAVHYCMGGIAIQGDGNVLDKGGKPINGVYAAGEIVGGIHGKNRLGGNALTECVILGRQVGLNIPFDNAQPPSIPPKSKPSEKADNSENTPPNELSGLPEMTMAEVKKHNSEGDVWIVLYGKVYDFSDFVDEHPGGSESLTNIAGMDGTENYAIVHSLDLLDDFDPIGIIKEKEGGSGKDNACTTNSCGIAGEENGFDPGSSGSGSSGIGSSGIGSSGEESCSTGGCSLKDEL